MAAATTSTAVRLAVQVQHRGGTGWEPTPRCVTVSDPCSCSRVLSCRLCVGVKVLAARVPADGHVLACATDQTTKCVLLCCAASVLLLLLTRWLKSVMGEVWRSRQRSLSLALKRERTVRADSNWLVEPG